MILLQLFWEYLKVGLFAVGGGLATIPFLTDLSARTGWFTTAELADMLAVSESTPGPIGVNVATYVGFRSAGVAGGIVAVLGLITPSVLIILIIAAFLQKFRSNPLVEGAFSGLRPASTGLIAAAALQVWSIALLREGTTLAADGLGVFHWPAILLFLVIFLCLQHKKLKQLHPIVFLAAAAVLGAVFQL